MPDTPKELAASNPQATTALRPHGPWRELCAASIGNALDFYDLLIYGYFAITLGNLFFPAHDHQTSLLLSVGTFGVSFVTRPLGALVLGSYADRAGRKASLTVSIALMMFGNALMVFTPTYAQIGVAAPLIIIVGRLLQGFSTGGEFGSSTALMVEHARPGHRGFAASWQISTQGLAAVLAAGISALLNWSLTAAQLNAWGWRLAFAVGLLIGPVGLYIRQRIDETPAFKALSAKQREKSPVRAVLFHDWRDMLLGIGLVAAVTAFNYVHKIYMTTYAVVQLHIPATSALLGAVVTGAVLMITAPMFGVLADRLGGHKVMLTALVLVAATTYPFFLMLTTWPSVATLLTVQALVGLLLAASLAPVPALLAEIFPTGKRGTGLSISYNLSVTIFGGFAPLILTWLIGLTHDKLVPSFYVIATTALSIPPVIVLGRRALRASRQQRTAIG